MSYCSQEEGLMVDTEVFLCCGERDLFHGCLQKRGALFPVMELNKPYPIPPKGGEEAEEL